MHDAVLDLFRKSGALLEGHFRLSSGCTAPATCSARSCCSIRSTPRRSGARSPSALRDLRPTVVLSPALGGIVIGHEVGRALGVRAIFAERQDGALTLRRGFTLVAEPIACSSSRTCSRPAARRARRSQVARGGRRDGRRRGVDRRSQRRCRHGSTCRSRRCSSIELPTYEPDVVSALRARACRSSKPGSAGS